MTNEEVLRGVWSEVGEATQDEQAQAALFGVDVRIRPKRIFKALYATVKVILAVKSGGGAAALADKPIEAIGVAPEVAGACESFLGVFYKKISELAYVVALFLGGSGAPTPIAELEEKLPAYMEDLKDAYAAGALPWYLRLTSERITRATNMLAAGLLGRELEEMKNQGLAEISDGGKQVAWVEKVFTFKGGWS